MLSIKSIKYQLTFAILRFKPSPHRHPICHHDPTPWVRRNKRAPLSDSPSNRKATPRTSLWGFAIAVAPGAATLSHFAGLSAKAEEWHLQQSNGHGRFLSNWGTLKHLASSCYLAFFIKNAK
jgi:hypothetical protein